MPASARADVLRSFQFGGIVPGLALAGGIAVAATILRLATGSPVLSPMLVSVFAGIAIRLSLRPGSSFTPGLRFAARPVLRLGIILLGLQVTLSAIIGIGVAPFLVAALTLSGTYVAIVALGRTMGVPQPLTRLIAAGTSVCGASAIVAANSVAQADEEDVGYAVACVTLFGTIAMIAFPLLAGPLGLSSAAFGVWTGAGIHEVAQVTAAAFQLGADAGQVGTLTKLIRVILLAPLVITIASLARSGDASGTAARTPFPWFVIWFLVMIGLNSTGIVPDQLRQQASIGSTLCMATGLAAMGLAMDLRQLRNRGLRPLLLGLCGTLIVSALSLGLVTAVM